MRILGILAVGAAVACGGGVVIVNNAPPPDAPPAVVTYGPSTMRYVSSQTRHIEQEVNGQVTANDVRTVIQLSAELAQGEAGLTATMTLDSITSTGGGVPPGQIAAARGAGFTGQLAPNGRIEGLTGDEAALSVLEQLRHSLADFYPTLPVGGALPGSVWTDTTTRDIAAGPLQVTIVATTRHEALGFTEYDGARALPIQSDGTYTLNGTGEQSGQQLTLDGTGQRHETAFVSYDGRFLGSFAADSANIDVLIEAFGLIIPVVQIGQDTIRVLR
ncbi:MAG TPA: hypothetical protein VGA37_12170 [Gemmatimonadales bacterium]